MNRLFHTPPQARNMFILHPCQGTLPACCCCACDSSLHDHQHGASLGKSTRRTNRFFCGDLRGIVHLYFTDCAVFREFAPFMRGISSFFGISVFKHLVHAHVYVYAQSCFYAKMPPKGQVCQSFCRQKKSKSLLQVERM